MNIKKIIGSKQGFTLIEMIVTLVLVGILAAIAGLGMVNMVNSFVSAKTNAATLLKGQIAIARIVKELNNIKEVDTANTTASKITFTSYRDADNHTLELSGANLRLGTDTLVDNVNAFTLDYYDAYNGAAQTTWASTRRVIEITLTLTGVDNIQSTFNARVSPSIMIGI